MDNEKILVRNEDKINEIAAKDGLQAAIDYANSLIDVRVGVVAGDGVYYPRAGFPEY